MFCLDPSRQGCFLSKRETNTIVDGKRDKEAERLLLYWINDQAVKDITVVYYSFMLPRFN